MLAACLACALVLLLADLRGAAPVAPLRGVAGAVAGPAEQALGAARGVVADRVVGPQQQSARIAELEAELAEVRAQAAAAAAGALDAGALAELAAVAPPTGFDVVPGRVVALTPAQDGVRAATLSVGSRDGARAGLAVVGATGLAGLVASVSPSVSTVRLVVDPATELAARVVSSGEVGVLRGTGTGATFTLLDPLGAMTAGDLVVTVGSPDLAVPSGLAVGRVARIDGSAADLSRVATVTPAVDDSTVDRLAVLVPRGAR